MRNDAYYYLKCDLKIETPGQQWQGELFWAQGLPNEWNIRFRENIFELAKSVFYESLYTNGKLYHRKPGYSDARDVHEFAFPNLLLNSNGILPLINQIDADIGTEQMTRIEWGFLYEKKVSNGLYDYTLLIKNSGQHGYRLQYRDTSGLNVTITKKEGPKQLHFEDRDQFIEPVPSYYTLG